MRTPRTTLATVATVFATLAAAPAAHAGLLAESAPDCTGIDGAAKVFAPWSDPSHYVPGPNGALESTTGWALSGAAGSVAGNEPFFVGDASDARSLRIPAGSSATSPVACVGVEHPTVRFFTRSSGTNLTSSLRVDVSLVGPLGFDLKLPVGVVTPTGGDWQPSPAFLVVANLLPLLPGEHTPVTFSFTPQGAGSWQVDDLYVDPWRNT